MLDEATDFRLREPWMIWFLPLSGAAIAGMYVLYGRTVEAGSNLIVEEILEPGSGVPLRMAPMVLVGTVVTHLFGGSAGREGSAVQMGGSIASAIGRLVPGLGASDIRVLLLTGVAAGFAGIFGTPVAGTIFAMEMLSIGRMQYGAVVPCLIAAIVSDQTCLAWGIQHTHYHVEGILVEGPLFRLSPVTMQLLVAVCAAAVLFGLVSRMFSELTHLLQRAFRDWIPRPLLRPVVGGILVLVLASVLGTRDFLGLGVNSNDASAVTIVSSFREGGASAWSWFWKLVFTAITVSSGFKGGEVTPLFFIGASLGCVLAGPLGVPVDFLAALGFVAVFAGATNTPLACTVMAVELFGGQHILYFAVACFVAFLFSGRSGIYQSQRIPGAKMECTLNETGVSLEAIRTRAGPPLSSRPSVSRSTSADDQSPSSGSELQVNQDQDS